MCYQSFLSGLSFKSHEVRRLEAALRYSQITESDIREFVADLLRGFHIDEVFKYDVALAAVAVAMEHWDNSFAETYLIDLARIERPEFRISFRMARECLKARVAYPKTQLRMSRYPQSDQVTRPPRNIRLIAMTQRLRSLESESLLVGYTEARYAVS